jgi:hypothetical protein
MSGGNMNHTREVSEQYLIDLEREAFLSLCGERQDPGAYRGDVENWETT